MSRQIISYDEEMVGASHPTKADTLNRALLVSHGDDGGLRRGTAFPTTELQDRMMFYRTDEDRLYVYDQADAAWRAAGLTFVSTGTGYTEVNTSSAPTSSTTLTLGGIPSSGLAKMVLLGCYVSSPSAGASTLNLRKKGETATGMVGVGVPSGTGPSIYGIVILPVGTDRQIDYWSTNGGTVSFWTIGYWI